MSAALRAALLEEAQRYVNHAGELLSHDDLEDLSKHAQHPDVPSKLWEELAMALRELQGRRLLMANAPAVRQLKSGEKFEPMPPYLKHDPRIGLPIADVARQLTRVVDSFNRDGGSSVELAGMAQATLCALTELWSRLTDDGREDWWISGPGEWDESFTQSQGDTDD